MTFRRLLAAALAALLASCSVPSNRAEPSESDQARALVERLRKRFPSAEGLHPAEVRRFDLEGGRLLPVLAAMPKAGWAEVGLPLEAAGAVRLREGGSGVQLGVAIAGAAGSVAEVVDGLVVYRGALPGADLIQRPRPAGFEDSIFFSQRPASEQVDYQVSLGDQVAGLRLGENTLEFLDESGTPRLRVSAPFLVDSTGASIPAALSVHGCAIDPSPAAPWGRPPIDPGSRRCSVQVRWSQVRYPALLDPAWTNTDFMKAGRDAHTATLLANGKVLLAGGTGLGGSPLSSAELYDPVTRTFAWTGSFTGPRTRHTASRLPSGEVLIAGGLDAAPPYELKTCRLYDPGSGTWSAAADMQFWRFDHAATLLADGRVFASGGVKAGTNLISTEVFQPDGGPGEWFQLGDLQVGRSSHTSTLLPDARILLVGGKVFNGVTATAETLGAQDIGGELTAGSLATARSRHTASLLPDGRVLIAGGFTVAGVASSAESFNPAANTFGPAGSLVVARADHTASVLDGGVVLIAGGDPGDGGSLNHVVLFDSRDAGWAVTSPLARAVRLHSATVLPHGQVLVAGGYPSGNTPPAELFSLGAAGNDCLTHSECWSGLCVDGVCCTSPCSGQCEACNQTGSKGTCAGVDGGPVGLRTPCLSDGSICGGVCNVALRSACTYPPGTTICRPATCSAGVATSQVNCISNGSCPAAITAYCSPYVCNGTGCGGSCSGPAGCAPGFACDVTQCVPNDGGVDGGADAGDDAGFDAGFDAGVDGGSTDAGLADAGTGDAGAGDAGAADAGAADAGDDGGAQDAGPDEDGGPADAGAWDGGGTAEDAGIPEDGGDWTDAGEDEDGGATVNSRRSVLGWSCGCGALDAGPAAMLLLALACLARRRPRSCG